MPKINLAAAQAAADNDNRQEGEFEPIPHGTLLDFEITGTEHKSNGKGWEADEFTFKVLGPKYAGRLVWSRITTAGSDKAVEIGQETYGQLVLGTGLNKEEFEPEELVGRKVAAKVWHDGEYNGKPRVGLRYYRAVSGAPASAPAPAAAGSGLPF